MDSFHTASDAAFWSCGDDQTTAWSETPGFGQPAPGFGFDLGLDSQLTVSMAFLRIMRDGRRSPSQDITWNSAPSFENPAGDSTAIANPDVTSTMGFSPAFTYPYAQPTNFNQMMYTVSIPCLVLYRRRWLTLSR
jgi:hypothetical protein